MNIFKKYLRKQHTAIIRLLEKKPEKFSPDTFHKLRIEIKKLRAFFKLIQYCNNNFNRKKYFKPYKRIFKLAGMVREIQVEERLLNDHFQQTSINQYKKHLDTLELKTRSRFFNAIKDHLISELSHSIKKLKLFLSEVDSMNMELYLMKKIRGLEKLLIKNELNSTQAHVLRKQLKEFHYITGYFHSYKSAKKYSKKDVLEPLLGDWHDCQVIMSHFNKTIRKGKLESDELETLKTILSRFNAQSIRLFNKIKKAIPKSEFYPVNERRKREKEKRRNRETEKQRSGETEQQRNRAAEKRSNSKAEKHRIIEVEKRLSKKNSTHTNGQWKADDREQLAEGSGNN